MKFGKYSLYAYPIFRIVVGLMFFTHGVQKLFGWFGGNAFNLMSQMGFVGLLEILGGLAVAFGFLTYLASLGNSLLMIIIYVKVHLPKGILPMSNGGELATMYFLAFMLILSKGSGIWSIDEFLKRKK